MTQENSLAQTKWMCKYTGPRQTGAQAPQGACCPAILGIAAAMKHQMLHPDWVILLDSGWSSPPAIYFLYDFEDPAKGLSPIQGGQGVGGGAQGSEDAVAAGQPSYGKGRR